MSFYPSLAATALSLLQEYGQSVTLSRTVRGTYDPATGAPAAGTTTTYTGTAAVFDYAQARIDGTDIRAGDQVAYLATDGVVLPLSGDTMTVGGVVYTVIRAGQLNPGGTAVLYDVQLRGLS